MITTWMNNLDGNVLASGMFIPPLNRMKPCRRSSEVQSNTSSSLFVFSLTLVVIYSKAQETRRTTTTTTTTTKITEHKENEEVEHRDG